MKPSSVMSNPNEEFPAQKESQPTGGVEFDAESLDNRIERGEGALLGNVQAVLEQVQGMVPEKIAVVLDQASEVLAKAAPRELRIIEGSLGEIYHNAQGITAEGVQKFFGTWQVGWNIIEANKAAGWESVKDLVSTRGIGPGALAILVVNWVKEMTEHLKEFSEHAAQEETEKEAA